MKILKVSYNQIPLGNYVCNEHVSTRKIRTDAETCGHYTKLPQNRNSGRDKSSLKTQICTWSWRDSMTMLKKKKNSSRLSKEKCDSKNSRCQHYHHQVPCRQPLGAMLLQGSWYFHQLSCDIVLDCPWFFFLSWSSHASLPFIFHVVKLSSSPLLLFLYPMNNDCRSFLHLFLLSIPC